MLFTEGLPPTDTDNQFIIKMSNHPTAVGMYNNEEKCFVIADVQATIHRGKPWDQYYDTSWIENKDILGYWCFPE